MVTILGQCPDCGDVRLEPSELEVRVCSDNDNGGYLFRCPECYIPVAKRTSARIIELLISSGVRLTMFRLPAELKDQDRNSKKPPLNSDDLLDFHVDLQNDELVAEELTGQLPNANSQIQPSDIDLSENDRSGSSDHSHSSDTDPHQHGF